MALVEVKRAGRATMYLSGRPISQMKAALRYRSGPPLRLHHFTGRVKKMLAFFPPCDSLSLRHFLVPRDGRSLAEFPIS